MRMDNIVETLKKQKSLKGRKVEELRLFLFKEWNEIIEEFNDACMNDSEI